MPASLHATLFIVCLGAWPAFADPAAHGALLAASCSSCHGLHAVNAGIPPLAGLKEAQIEQSLLAYRTGRRSSQIMQVVSTSLTPEEIDEVSRYLAAQRLEPTR
jgi:cytochrome c553